MIPRGKLVAILTGAISILIAIAYLVIVQLLDFRGEMLPAPVSQLPSICLIDFKVVFALHF
jgi:hypothetical protein